VWVREAHHYSPAGPPHPGKVLHYCDTHVRVICYTIVSRRQENDVSICY